MALDQLKAFLTELQKNKELLNAIRVAATANEIIAQKSQITDKYTNKQTDKQKILTQVLSVH